MRILKEPLPEELGAAPTFGVHPPFGMFADGRTSPEDILKIVDGLLKPHGLEVVQYQGSRPDLYIVRIDRREEGQGGSAD